MRVLRVLSICLLIVFVTFGAGITFAERSRVGESALLVAGLLSLMVMGISMTVAAESSELRLPFWPKSEWSFEGTGQFEGWAGGVLGEDADEELLPYCCRNNSFESNKYALPNPEGYVLSWEKRRMGVTEWSTYYHPEDGTVSDNCSDQPFWELTRYEDFETGDLEDWSVVVGAE